MEVIGNTCLRNVTVRVLGASFVPSCRFISVRKNADRRMERYLKRTADLIAGKTNKNSKGVPVNSMFRTEFLAFNNEGPRNTGIYEGRIPKSNNPRVKRLSTMLFNYITSLIDSGEICPELLDLGFQISDVTMSPNFNLIIVSWLDSNSEHRDKILSMLPKCSADLRSVLTGLRVMGNVPPIQFSRDISYIKAAEVEKLLEVADMGPAEKDDIEDEDECELSSTETETENFTDIKSLQNHNMLLSQRTEEPASQNVYGINYDEMKKEILMLKNKMKK